MELEKRRRLWTQHLNSFNYSTQDTQDVFHFTDHCLD